MHPRIRVLIVDDERRFVENTSRLLQRRGFEVATAFDGREALNIVRGGKAVDVVVLDVKMPASTVSKP